MTNTIEKSLRNKANRFKAKAKLSASRGGGIVASIQIPSGILGIRRVDSPENHCLMRALDRMLVDGNPATGKIGAILLLDMARGGMRCLASFAVTDWSKGHGILRGHRFILFPSWKSPANMVMFADDSGNRRVMAAHHITYDSNSDGSLNCHATTPDRRDRHTLCRKMMVEDGCIVIGQTLVQNHNTLDPVGRLRRHVAWPSDSGKMIRIWEASLRRNFAEYHPAIIPPGLTNKEDDGVVLASLRLSNLKPETVSTEWLQKGCFSEIPLEDDLHRRKGVNFFIRIYPDLFLTATVFRVSGTLKSDSVWVFPDGLL